MPVVTATVLSAIGVAATVAGTIGSIYFQSQQASAQRRAERLREQQMNLDAARRRREMIRQGEMQRAQALSQATQQGAAEGSVLEGTYGTISGNTGRNVQGVNQAQEIGAGIFAANRDASSAGSMANGFSGLSSLGGIMVKQAEPISRVGEYFRGSSGFSSSNGHGGGSLFD